MHTRLVTKEVGKLVETYRDSPELLSICADAFLGTLAPCCIRRILLTFNIQVIKKHMRRPEFFIVM